MSGHPLMSPTCVYCTVTWKTLPRAFVCPIPSSHLPRKPPYPERLYLFVTWGSLCTRPPGVVSVKCFLSVDWLLVSFHWTGCSLKAKISCTLVFAAHHGVSVSWESCWLIDGWVFGCLDGRGEGRKGREGREWTRVKGRTSGWVGS